MAPDTGRNLLADPRVTSLWAERQLEAGTRAAESDWDI